MRAIRAWTSETFAEFWATRLTRFQVRIGRMNMQNRSARTKRMPSGIQNESSKLGYLESGRSIADWMRFTWAWGAWRSWARAGGGREYLLGSRLETGPTGKCDGAKI